MERKNRESVCIRQKGEPRLFNVPVCLPVHCPCVLHVQLQRRDRESHLLTTASSSKFSNLNLLLC